MRRPWNALTPRRLAALGAVLLLIGGGAVLLLAGGGSRTDEIRSAMGFDGCAHEQRSVPSRDPDLDDWGAAVETRTESCGEGGPVFTYTRFPSPAELRRTLLDAPPSSAVCLLPTEVVLNGLDRGEFAPACRRLDGQVVSRTTRVTPAGGLSIDALDRSGRRFAREASAAMGTALRRHWRAADRR